MVLVCENSRVVLALAACRCWELAHGRVRDKHITRQQTKRAAALLSLSQLVLIWLNVM